VRAPSFTPSGEMKSLVQNTHADHWALGYPDQAAEHIDAALFLARKLGHLQSLVMALHSAAQLHQVRGEVSLA